MRNRTQKIGESIVANEARWKAVQSALGTVTDGWPGTATLSELEDELEISPQVTPLAKGADLVDRPDGEFPTTGYDAMVDFYGLPGTESNLVRVEFPYKMRLYSRAAPLTVTGHRAHRKCAESLRTILEDLLAHYGEDGLKEHGLDVFGGIYNDRNTRGGNTKSKHAWGVAIDLNPAENRNRQRWASDKVGQSGWANMPIKAVELFEKHGWKSGGRAWGRDAMHFQATR